VVLIEFSKYCWGSDEIFNAQIVVANYSNQTINTELDWEICKQDGTIVSQGSFSDLKIGNGGLFSIGELREELSSIRIAEKLIINLSIENTGYSNTYQVWVYPAETKIVIQNDLTVEEKLTPQVISKLQNGGKVLLFPQTEDVKGKSFAGHFPPEYWNYGMFKG
jgi:hypothetical protein